MQRSKWAMPGRQAHVFSLRYQDLTSFGIKPTSYLVCKKDAFSFGEEEKITGTRN
jgi:hypothetical protein